HRWRADRHAFEVDDFRARRRQRQQREQRQNPHDALLGRKTQARNESMRSSTFSQLMLLKNASTYCAAAAPKSMCYECSYISMTSNGVVVAGECMWSAIQ